MTAIVLASGNPRPPRVGRSDLCDRSWDAATLVMRACCAQGVKWSAFASVGSSGRDGAYVSGPKFIDSDGELTSHLDNLSSVRQRVLAGKA